MRSGLVVYFVLASVGCAEVRYSIISLMPVDDQAVGSGSGNGLNAVGDVAGSFFNQTNGTLHAFFNTAGEFVDLGTSPGGTLQVSGLNNSHQIAAYGTANDGRTHAFRYSPGLDFVDLGHLGGVEAETSGINNLGQVTGFSISEDGSEHAFRYTDGVGMVDLGKLPNAVHSSGKGINDLGWVTGTSGNRTFVYRDGLGMVDLGPGRGWAVNNAGVVAGESSSGQPVVYINGQMQMISGTLGAARAINNRNVAVGYTFDGISIKGFVWWEGSGIEDLNSLIDPGSGWYITAAAAINDDGQIVGIGGFSGRPGLSTAFRLDPIPPRLQIVLEETNVVVSWSPPWPGLLLETASVLSPASWYAVAGGTNSPVVLPASGTGQLFRLGRYDSIDPKLSIAVSGTNVAISWAPPWADCLLESTASLSSPAWTVVPGATNSPLTLPLTNATCFFRLRK